MPGQAGSSAVSPYMTHSLRCWYLRSWLRLEPELIHWCLLGAGRKANHIRFVKSWHSLFEYGISSRLLSIASFFVLCGDGSDEGKAATKNCVTKACSREPFYINTHPGIKAFGHQQGVWCQVLLTGSHIGLFPLMLFLILIVILLAIISFHFHQYLTRYWIRRLPNVDQFLYDHVLAPSFSFFRSPSSMTINVMQLELQ